MWRYVPATVESGINVKEMKSFFFILLAVQWIEFIAKLVDYLTIKRHGQ